MSESKTEKKLYYGWWVVVAMFILMFPGSLIMNAASIFYTVCSEDLGVTITQYGMNLTIIMVGCAVFNMTIYKKMVEKYKLRNLLSISLVVEALCFALRAVSSNIWLFYVSSLFITFPMSMMYNLSIPILMNAWFPKKAGTTIGIIGAAQGLGGALFSTLGGIIMQNYGWRVCFWVWTIICIIALPIALLLIKQSPAEIGIQPLGVETATAGGVSTTLERGLSAQRAKKTVPFIVFCIALPLSAFAANLHAYFTPYVQSLGVSIAMAGSLYSLVPIGNFFYKITLGIVCDKNMKAGMWYFLLSSIMSFVLLFICGGNIILIGIAFFLIGGIYAAGNLFGPVMVKYLFGTKGFTELWAIAAAMMCYCGAAGSVVWGAILERSTYTVCFMIGLIILIAVLIMYNMLFASKNKIDALINEEENK